MDNTLDYGSGNLRFESLQVDNISGSISMVDGVLWEHVVAGSSPVFPTNLNPDYYCVIWVTW